MRAFLVVALAAVLASAQQPQCDDARAQCESSCAAQSLVVTSFLCRDTPFGSLQSCSCGASASTQEAQVPDESADGAAAVSQLPFPFSQFLPGASTSSSSADSSSSSGASSDTGIMVIDGPRRLGPQAVWMPMQQADPYAAARVAILSNLLQQQRAAPVLALQFDLQRMSDSGQEDEDMHARMHHDHHEREEDDDDDDLDDEPPCLMGLAVLAALVFTSAFVCTRALRMMLARSAQPRTMVAAQPVMYLDASDDLASPLLVVHQEKA
jgi:hypothetical protein